MNEPALGTGPPTPRLKMAVSEDAGFGAAAAPAVPARRGSDPPSSSGAGVGDAAPALVGPMRPEGGGGPTPGTTAALSFSFF